MAHRLRVVRLFIGIIASAIILTGTYQPLTAQIGTANLSGTVVDSSGAAIPEAQVVLKSATQNASRETTTDPAGRYQIPAILPGVYNLVVQMQGFETAIVNNVNLTSGQGSTLNVALRVGKTVTQVNVVQSAPLLETTTAAVGSVVTAKQYVELPLLGRNFTTLIQILPGVAPVVTAWGSHEYSPTGTSLNPSIMGNLQRSNVYNFDGLPNEEILFNGIVGLPPPEAIAEMKVQAGTDMGQIGWASGASINLVSKSGTNAYHGDAWEFVRNNALNARNFFDPSVAILHYNQFGAAAGGPLQIPHLISRDRNWYVFAYYEGIRIPSSSFFSNLYPTAAELQGDFSADPIIYNPYTSTVSSSGVLLSRQAFPGNIITPGACAPLSACLNASALSLVKSFYPLPNLAPGVVPGKNFIGRSTSHNSPNQWSVRADHQFGHADNFFARFSEARNPSTSVNLPPAPQIPGVTYIHTDSLAFGDTHAFNPTTYVTARGGWQRVNWRVLNPVSALTQAGAAGLLSTFPPWHGMDLVPIIGIAGYPSMANASTLYGPENLFTVTVDAQKIVGKHTLGFGGNFWRDKFLVDNLSNTSETFTNTITASNAGTGGYALASFLLGLPSSAARQVGSSAGDMHSKMFGLYVQDGFRVTPKLTVNYGVRWEYAQPQINNSGSSFFLFETGQWYWDVKNPATGAAANIRRGGIDPDYHCFSPRIGVAYQLPSQTVVRASYGIFFDTLGAGYGQTQQGNRGNWPFAYPQTVTGLNTGIPSAYLQNPFPGPAVQPAPTGIAQNLNAEPSSSRVGYVNEWSLSVQHAFGSRTTAEVAYFGSLGVKMAGQMLDNVATRPGTDSYKNRQVWPALAPYPLNGWAEANTWYDGLIAKVTVRATHNLDLLVDYTYSKTMDINDMAQSIAITRYNLGYYRAPAMYNIPNMFNLSYIYNLPQVSHNRFLNAVIGGWSTSGIFNARTGNPYFVVLSTDNEGVGSAAAGRNTQFPNLVNDPTTGFTRSLNQWFNTAAYTLPTFGTRGNAGRHALYAESLTNFNAALYKRWTFREGKNVELRGEAFNLPNSHYFGAPGSSYGTSSFGKVSSTSNSGRTIQLAIKLHF